MACRSQILILFVLFLNSISTYYIVSKLRVGNSHIWWKIFVQNPHGGLDWLCASHKVERARWKMRSNFKAPFLSFQNSAEPTSQVNHQSQPLSFSNNTKEPCITATDHLRHPQLHTAHSAAVKKEIKAIFFTVLLCQREQLNVWFRAVS